MPEQSPFDILAETYDADFTRSQIGKLQRKRVRQLLTKILKSHKQSLKILEINCGTGEDALWLAEMGHTVVATDASSAMIKKAQQKLAASGFIIEQITFLQCSFSELSLVLKQEKFDVVFSNFGGINCINKNEILQLSNDLSNLLNDKGIVFLTVMSRYCFWETLYY